MTATAFHCENRSHSSMHSSLLFKYLPWESPSFQLERSERLFVWRVVATFSGDRWTTRALILSTWWITFLRKSHVDTYIIFSIHSFLFFYHCIFMWVGNFSVIFMQEQRVIVKYWGHTATFHCSSTSLMLCYTITQHGSSSDNNLKAPE